MRSTSSPRYGQRRPCQREWAHWHVTDDGIELLDAGYVEHVYERHIHDTYAIGVTLTGVQRYWCRGATHDSTPGHVIAINPGDAHDGRSGTDDGYSYRMVYVPMDVMRSFVQDATEQSSADMTFGSPLVNDPDLARRLTAAWSAMADPTQPLAGETLLCAVLHRLATSAGLRVRHDTHVDLDALHRVRDYLHARVEDGVRVAELAQVASMSRFRLTRRFERAFGLPLHAYHLHIKLEEAKRRLRRQVPITHVAADLGFADQSHFHRRFKGAFGMTPGAWRRTPIAQRSNTARLPSL